MAAFEELGIMPEIVSTLSSMEWILPTDIQAEAIPMILGGGDVLMAAETGSGKTGAFSLPLLQVVWETLNQSKKDSNEQHTSAQHLIRSSWSLSVSDRARDLVLNSDHTVAQSKSSNWQGCRSNNGIKRLISHQEANLKYYFEVHFIDKGLARVGWSLRGANLELGVDSGGWGYGGTAKKSTGRNFSDYGSAFGEKFDIIGCILDLKNGEMIFTKNGRSAGVAFKLNTQMLQRQYIYPTICVKTACCHVVFGHDSKINDYKPQDCTWVNEADEKQIESTCTHSNELEKRGSTSPLAIIIEPSRELAEQTYDCIKKFATNLKVSIHKLIGGHSNVLSSDVDIIVATPGRLAETIRDDNMSLNHVHFFILDECDGLLKQGNKNLITTVYNKIPKMFSSGRRLQTICCSATLHDFDVKRLANQLMYFPVWIDLKGEDSVPDTVHHVFVRIDPNKDKSFVSWEGLIHTDGVHDKDRVDDKIYNPDFVLSRPEEVSEAIKLLKFHYTVEAIRILEMDSGIIFCRTKLDCDNLEDFMNHKCKQTQSNQFSCVCLHADRSPSERTTNLQQFKDKKIRFLICTDVAARGIDIRGIPFVIQVTLPDDKACYLHRIGRVGRADKMGLAISLVATAKEKVWFHANCRNYRQCHNTRLKENKGCCIWLDELSLLGDVEAHLKCTIQEIESDFRLQVDEYDGKVIYGQKKLEQTYTYEGHVKQLERIVSSLNKLESESQRNFLEFYI